MQNNRRELLAEITEFLSENARDMLTVVMWVLVTGLMISLGIIGLAIVIWTFQVNNLWGLIALLVLLALSSIAKSAIGNRK